MKRLLCAALAGLTALSSPLSAQEPELRDSGAYDIRGEVYEKNRDYDKAIADYTEAIRLNPKHADAHYGRGTAYRRKGAYGEAIRDFTETVRLNPKHADAYYGRGIAYRHAGEYDKAIADYSEAIRLNPNSAQSGSSKQYVVLAGAAYCCAGPDDSTGPAPGPQPIFDPTFSDGSFGFRPGRSAHGAIVRAREHIAAGYGWVVDLDLEKFFDRVNHDVLMARVARRVKDKRVLLLIRRYLQAGMMEGGVVSPRGEGTPQGAPLSPLLSNVLLDELDKELEQRGHRFVRYADDCNVYVQSEEAGKRVMASLERFLAKRLRLKINRDKSAVAGPRNASSSGTRSRGTRSRRSRWPQVGATAQAQAYAAVRRGRGRPWSTRSGNSAASCAAGWRTSDWRRSRPASSGWTTGCDGSCAASVAAVEDRRTASRSSASWVSTCAAGDRAWTAVRGGTPGQAT